jgi:hypothetical protein
MKFISKGIGFLALLVLLFALTGMIGRGGVRRGELRPEIRLKIYNEAIGHYEKARALYETGQEEAALAEIRKATRAYSRFPEAYQLAQAIYLKQGKAKEAQEQAVLFRYTGGAQGETLYAVREETIREIELRKASARPPDIEPARAFLLSGGVSALLLLGMILEYWRLTRPTEESKKTESIFLGKFPSDEEKEAAPSWLFKLLALLFPAPFLFLLLVLLGFRYYSDLWPLFAFSWTVTALAVYLIFFADLQDLGGLRKPRPGG